METSVTDQKITNAFMKKTKTTCTILIGIWFAIYLLVIYLSGDIAFLDLALIDFVGMSPFLLITIVVFIVMKKKSQIYKDSTLYNTMIKDVEDNYLCDKKGWIVTKNRMYFRNKYFSLYGIVWMYPTKSRTWHLVFYILPVPTVMHTIEIYFMDGKKISIHGKGWQDILPEAVRNINRNVMIGFTTENQMTYAQHIASLQGRNVRECIQKYQKF